MKIFAIADLHLAISTPEKTMEAFGSSWTNYHERLQKNWQQTVAKEDLVLIAGDISWALHLQDALKDLEWLNQLPGTKILLKGNHDYWWPSTKKLQEILPQGMTFIHNNALTFQDVAIGGARLWDDHDFSLEDLVSFKPSPLVKQKKVDLAQEKRLFEKELLRLENSLSQMNKEAKIKICMTHYPPLPNNLADSKASKIIESHDIDFCVFGHLHNVETKNPIFGKKGKTTYFFVAADYLGFMPKLIFKD